MNKPIQLMSLIALAPIALLACSEQGGSQSSTETPSAETHDEHDGTDHSGHDHAHPEPASEAAEHAPPATPGVDAAAQDNSLTVANFSFTPPEGWTPQPPSNSMRLAEMSVANPGGEPSVAVFSAAGGDVESNIARWIGQFANPGGEVVSGRETRTIAGQTVHLVEMSGEFRGMGMKPPQADTMMRAAIVEQAGGQHLFVKMTGPVSHMSTLTDDWNALIGSLQTQ